MKSSNFSEKLRGGILNLCRIACAAFAKTMVNMNTAVIKYDIPSAYQPKND